MKRITLATLLLALWHTPGQAQRIVAACSQQNLTAGNMAQFTYMNLLGDICMSGGSGGGGVVTNAGTFAVQNTAATPAGTNSIGGVTIKPGAATPLAGTASAITTGGTAITLVTGPVNGCYITNPLTATDQNITTAEVAYFNPVTTATANGRGTNTSRQPGESWSCIPGQTTNVSAIAATIGHAFNVVVW